MCFRFIICSSEKETNNRNSEETELSREINSSLRPYPISILFLLGNLKCLSIILKKTQVSDKILMKEIRTDDDTLCSTS